MTNWKKLKPDDGFFAAVNISGEVRAELVFGIYVEGKLLETHTVNSVQWPTDRTLGMLKRDLIFWEGVAEYLNAGGHIVDAVDSLGEVMGKFAFCGLGPFDGWSYFDTGVNQNGNRVHEFISNNNEAVPCRFVRWVRGEFVDYNLTEGDMKEMENVKYVGRGEAADAGDLCGANTETEGQADSSTD